MAERETAVIHHLVRSHETFETAVQHILQMVQAAQARSPGYVRHLYLDIEGHRNADGGFDADMLELQREFVLGFLMPYMKRAQMPLGTYENPGKQDDAVPEKLEIVKER